MKTLAKQVIGGRRKYTHVRKLDVLLTLLVAFVGLPSKAQSQDGNWAHSPPGTFLDQSSPSLGQSQWQQPAGTAGQASQPQWQQPANNSGQLGQSQWQQPANNSGQPGQSQWQQPANNSGQPGQSQWQQPSQSQWQPTDSSVQMGQSQWQQPTNSSGQVGQSQWQQPGTNSGQGYPSQLPQSVINTQPVQNNSGQVGLSPWQQPDESAEQMGQSQEGQDSLQQSTEATGQQTGPFTNSRKVNRPPLLGEVLKQEQTQQPGNDTLSIDQSSSLSAAAGDAMNTPIGSMAAGALSSFGLGQGLGQGAGQLTPQQIQQMIPGVLNFMMNVMPPPSNRTNAGPNTSGFGSFPHFGTNYSTRRPMYRPQSSQGMNRVINNVIRRGGVPGMNQMHF